MPTDCGEAVSTTEGCDAAGPLTHRIRRKRCTCSIVRGFDQSHKDILRPANLTVQFNGQSGGNDRSLLRTSPGQQTDHRGYELVKVKDRRSRESRQHDHCTASGRRKTDGLAGLESNTVSDNARINEFGNNTIGNVSFAFTRATRQKHDVRELEGLAKSGAQGIRVIMNNAQSFWHTTQFSHRIAEHLAVGI